VTYISIHLFILLYISQLVKVHCCISTRSIIQSDTYTSQYLLQADYSSKSLLSMTFNESIRKKHILLTLTGGQQ